MTELPQHLLATWRTEQGFRQIYQHYAPFVWRVAFRTTNGDDRIATEITQVVFLQMLQGLPTFRFDAAFSSWLYRITYHEVIRQVKRERKYRQSHAEVSENLEDRHNFALDQDQQAQLARLLAPLTDEERFLLVSREVDDLSFEELAIITGKTSGALRTEISRLKRRLQGGVDAQ